MPQVTAMPKIELPPPNITPEDHAKYEAEYDTRWDGYPVDAIVALLNSRERELRAALSELSELRKASDGWVSVRDSMPEKDARVDVWCVWPLTGKGSRIPDARYAADSIGAYWTGAMGHIAESVITHWRSFPEPPQPLPASAVEEKKDA